VLPELLEAYRRGETGVQRDLLDEVEPLLYGMVRSLMPGGAGAQEQAIRFTNALVLAFHLRASRGEVALADANALRALAHRMASRKLRDPDPLVLNEEPDSMIDRCFGLGPTIEAALDDRELSALIDRLEGAGAEGDTWKEAERKLTRLGVVGPTTNHEPRTTN